MPRPLSRLSIRTLVLLLALAFMLPLSGILAWGLKAEADDARETAYAGVRALADAKANQLELLVSDHEELLHIVAAEFRGDPPVRSASFDPGQFMRMHQQILNLAVRDLSANSIYAHLPNPLSAATVARTPWAAPALRSGSFVAGAAFWGQNVGRWVSVLSAPVLAADGKQSGVVNFAIDLKGLNDRVMKSVPTGAIISVLDQQDAYLLRSLDPEKWLGQRAASSAIDTIRRQREGYGATRNVDGVDYMFAFVSVPHTDWRVVASVREADALAGYYALRSQGLVLGAFTLLLTLLLAWWLASAIVGPVQALARTSASVADGDAAARAALAGPAEVQAVAGQLNRMLDARAEVEAALRLSDERFHLVTRATNDAVWDWDLKTNALWWSEGFQALFGYAAEDIEPGIESWTGRLHPDDLARVKSSIYGVINGPGDHWDAEYRFRRKDGRHADIFDRAYVIRDASGQGVRMVGAMVDLSERKQAERALEAANRELARSNAELEQFAYVASHDLQEPLRSVSSCVQLLKKRYAGVLDARADEFIAHAVGGSQRMQLLIDDLLTYSRVSAAPHALAAIDSAAALAAACANLERAIADSGAQVSHGDLPTVQVDRGQLVQLLQNLVGNALKFCGEAPARVHVSATLAGDEWVFAVADQGIGIDPQYFTRIFRLFQRLHTREEYAGTGIGLTICQRIVERHRGRIWVESQPGAGATFCFTLPVSEQAARSPSP